MNELNLTKQLIQIQSEVSEKCDEQRIGNFIIDFCKTIPWLSVSKQYIDGKRFNVIAQSQSAPRLLLAGHMDTVPKKSNQKSNGLPLQVENRLYGLGALDTKGGVASLLVALQNSEPVDGLMCVFYCDEEYDFLGMKKFVGLDLGGLKQALFIEPTDLKLWNAHRGVIEIEFVVEGKTGHASNPQNGNNAITALSKSLVELEQWLKRFNEPDLGRSTLNIASIRGGIKTSQKDGSFVTSSAGNCIADYAECVIEIRPSVRGLRANNITDFISDALRKSGCSVTWKINHDLGSLNTPVESLAELKKSIQEVVGVCEALDPKTRGYGDGQLLAEKLQIPVAYFGPNGKGMHEESEYVEISSLTQTRRVFESFIERVLGHR